MHRLYFPAATAAQTHAEHQRVAAAIVAGEPAAATAAMRAHLTAARERHLPAFDQQPAPGQTRGAG
nr:FCD domain-containing protein [Micromonospora orduensis]